MKSTYLEKSKIPDTPGVYLFKKGKAFLYIGKATSLRDRLRSYFVSDIRSVRSPIIEKMVELATDVEWQETDSVLEALVLEAHLIKKHQPLYNSKEKDNKSFSYVVITEEDFPRVITVRGRELEKISAEGKKKGSANSTTSANIIRTYGVKKMYGPFTSLSALKEALKIIRKLFPYRDNRCLPAQAGLPRFDAEPALTSRQVKAGLPRRVKAGLPEPRSEAGLLKGKPCFNYQLGLCPGTCVGEVSKKEYQRVIRNISLFFEGKKTKLLETLTKEMNAYAKKEMFEEAKKVRNTIWSLKHINDVSLMKREIAHAGMRQAFRIEAYDVAHFGGKETVGVMTVLEDGEVNKDEYRKFNVRGDYGGGDTGSLREILTRRFTHSEWRHPTLVVVDGSTAQINVAEKVLKEIGLPTPVVGVVKDEYHRPKNIKGDAKLISKHENEILQANDEAHRFSIKAHRKRRKII